MATVMKLVPDAAADSIAVRIATIKQCEAYVKDVYARYEGLKALENALEAKGIKSDVLAIAAKKG